MTLAEDVQELRLEANGLQFHALAAGPSAGPLVLLLHGFPELALSWAPQVAALGAAGFRAVAPDLRGYGGTSKQGPFDAETLAQDVAALVRTLGRQKAVVVGHDWGGGVAWAVSAFAPEVLERLIVLDCPHPAILLREILTNPRQLMRSWYMFFFQIPWLPEWIITRDGASAVGRSLRGGSSIRDAWTREKTKPYQDNFLQPGAASAALGYYRAAFRSGGVALRRAAKAHPIAVPTLILWGGEDRFLGQELLEEKKLRPFFAPGNLPKVQILEGVGHFVQVEAPERVTRALLDWLPKP
ncbi:MAG TPA: alpha/beta hydrolase [Myxococcales bacterium]|nr:alpha/beta hydrolase [Myxococcales bacterium]